MEAAMTVQVHMNEEKTSFKERARDTEGED